MRFDGLLDQSGDARDRVAAFTFHQRGEQGVDPVEERPVVLVDRWDAQSPGVVPGQHAERFLIRAHLREKARQLGPQCLRLTRQFARRSIDFDRRRAGFSRGEIDPGDPRRHFLGADGGLLDIAGDFRRRGGLLLHRREAIVALIELIFAITVVIEAIAFAASSVPDCTAAILPAISSVALAV